MKDELRDFIVNIGLINIGLYAKTYFGLKKYSKKQILAMVLFGIAIVYILHLSKIPALYQTSISLVAGLIMNNIITAIIKAGNKSEDKAADKISDKFDNLI